jgi:hypothetical protein
MRPYTDSQLPFPEETPEELREEVLKRMNFEEEPNLLFQEYLESLTAPQLKSIRFALKIAEEILDVQEIDSIIKDVYYPTRPISRKTFEGETTKAIFFKLAVESLNETMGNTDFMMTFLYPWLVDYRNRLLEG